MTDPIIKPIFPVLGQLLVASLVPSDDSTTLVLKERASFRCFPAHELSSTFMLLKIRACLSLLFATQY